MLRQLTLFMATQLAHPVRLMLFALIIFFLVVVVTVTTSIATGDISFFRYLAGPIPGGGGSFP